MREARCAFCGAVLALAALALPSGCDREREVAAVYGGPPLPVPTPTASTSTSSVVPAPPHGGAASTGAEAVRKHLGERDPSHAGKLEVHQDDVPKLPLAGVELWHADVVIPDGWTEACWVVPAGVACAGEDGALERLVVSQGLAKEPGKLTDAEWLDLVRFATGGVVVASHAEAKKLLAALPADVKVTPPAVERPAGGLSVSFFLVVVANDSGPVALAEHALTIADGAVKVAHTERWHAP